MNNPTFTLKFTCRIGDLVGNRAFSKLKYALTKFNKIDFESFRWKLVKYTLKILLQNRTITKYTEITQKHKNLRKRYKKWKKGREKIQV